MVQLRLMKSLFFPCAKQNSRNAHQLLCKCWNQQQRLSKQQFYVFHQTFKRNGMYHKRNFTLTHFTGCGRACTVHKTPGLLLLISVWLNFSLLLSQIIRCISWVELRNCTCGTALSKRKSNHFLHQCFTSMKCMFTIMFYSLLVQI